MPKLIISESTYMKIWRIVYRGKVCRERLETGARLFGKIKEDRYIVEHIAGPGKNAIQRHANYECDNEYAEKLYNRLLEEDPELLWLGELHAHPSYFPRLSLTDINTCKEVLTGTDDCLHPEQFICGIMIRQLGGIRIYLKLFTKDNLEGEDMSLEIPKEEYYVREKPNGKRNFIQQISGYSRRWKRWIFSFRDVN